MQTIESIQSHFIRLSFKIPTLSNLISSKVHKFSNSSPISLQFLLILPSSPSTISLPPSPIIPRPTPPLPRLFLHLPPTPSQRLRKRNPTRPRPNPPMHQIRPPIQTQPLQTWRIDDIRLRVIIIGELPVVFDDAVFVPVALRCFQGVDDPGFLV